MAASVESTNAAFADSEVHVFLGISLDGFIAGPNGELDWLEACIPTVDNFTPFMERVGAIVMGRKTFDVVAGKCPPGTDWPYGDIPMLVPTSRPIGAELFAARPSVQAATGTILEILALAREQAGPGKLVYVDGGSVVRQSLDAGLVDEITLSVVPKILGAGIRLWDTGEPDAPLRALDLTLSSVRELGAGLLETRYRTKPGR